MILTKIWFLFDFVIGESSVFDPGLGHCNSHQYPCQGTNLCISMRKVCDCSVDCPNGDDELECPSELMSLIEAELGQCIKPSTPSQISDSDIGACQEADFDKQRDCVCTAYNTLECASPTGRNECIPTHLKDKTKPCCEKDDAYFCHSKNQTQIHSRQKNGPNVITTAAIRKGTIWSPNRCYGPEIACEHGIWDKISDCRDEPGQIYRDQYCTLDDDGGVPKGPQEMPPEAETLPCGIHEVCDLFFNRDNSAESLLGFSLTLFACILSLFF